MQDLKRYKVATGEEGSGVSDNTEGTEGFRQDDVAHSQSHNTSKTVEIGVDNMNTRFNALDLASGQLRSDVESLKAKNKSQDMKYEVLLDLTIKKTKPDATSNNDDIAEELIKSRDASPESMQMTTQPQQQQDNKTTDEEKVEDPNQKDNTKHKPEYGL